MDNNNSTQPTNRNHGGKRPGAGRPSRFDVPTQQKTIRLPLDQIQQLTDEFGSVQRAVEVIVASHFLTKDAARQP